MASWDRVHIDERALTAAMARAYGFDQDILRTPEEVELFRRRSASSRKGWATRRKKPEIK
jgi:hypothetical protein